MKNKMMLLLVLAFGYSMANASEMVKKSATIAASRLGDVSINLDKDGYSLVRNGKRKAIDDNDVDPLLREVAKRKCLAAYQDHCAIKVLELGDDFRLEALVPVVGGGPILAKIFYGITKAGLWGIVGAGVVGSIATLPGRLAAGVATDILAPLGTAKGAATVTLAIVEAGGAPAAAELVVAGSASTSGGFLGIGAAIEAAAMTAGAFGATIFVAP